LEIYLLRHAIAEDARPGSPDSARSLTPEGRRKLREVMRRAKSAGVDPAVILSSPYKRAVQTAEIAAEILGYQGETLLTKALVPASGPELVWEEIRIHKDSCQIMLVGHEPLFSHLTAFLLNAPTLQLDFKKGGLARIDMKGFGPRPSGVLRWFLAPKLATGD
jgi:phosphohistidine phosphatase